jgi:hypothetical protein
VDGLGRAVGDGITSAAHNAFDAMGSTVRALFSTAQSILPNGLLFVIGFVVLLALAWTFAKR